jgi:hypothetical protein
MGRHIRGLFLGLALALGGGALGGCGGDAEGAACDADASVCADGEVCVKGACRTPECTTSADCAIQKYCTEGYVCEPGCSADADCRAGQVCNATNNKCVAYGCRTTELDCEIAEVCDEQTGECEQAPGEWCQTCQSANPYSCGQGYLCLAWDEGGPGWCFPEVAPQDECPRGFYAYDLGAPYGTICVGDCPFYTENGYL